jgi:aminoglycoside phosphotransferase (APT) family kinase protein
LTNPPGSDIDRALAFVNTQLIRNPGDPKFRATRMVGGRSNLTYRLDNGRGDFVLRCSPGIPSTATAHDMQREFRVISALCRTGVPVPEPVLLAPSDVIGAPFYVMQYVPGTVFRGRHELGARGQTVERSVALSLVDTLAVLHAVDPRSVGLGEFGRADGYLARQIQRWRREHARYGDTLDEVGSLGTRLESTVPQTQQSTIVHGDFRLENVIVSDTDHSVAAVLDWELATLGDPLVDLASMIAWWDGIPVLESLLSREQDAQAAPRDLDGPSHRETLGYSARALVARYAAATQLQVDSLPWYTGLCFLKLAVLFEGILDRRTRSNGMGNELDMAVVPQLAQAGQNALDSYPTIPNEAGATFSATTTSGGRDVGP